MTVKTFWKYPLEWSVTDVEMPAGAEVVHVGMQEFQVSHNESRLTPTLWAMVDPSAEKVARTFHRIPTGMKLPGVVKYHGTVMDGPFVWHVCEVIE